MGRKHPGSEIVADDGLHRVERISVSDAAYKASRPQGKRDDSAEQERMMDLLDKAAHAKTFEGAIGEAEAYWRGVTADPTAKPLSKAWYRARIIREVEWLRLSKTLAVTDDAALLDYVQMHALADRLQATVDGLDELTYVKITTVVLAHGNPVEVGEPKMHPAVAQLRAARMAKKAMLVEFGQTPASRSRVKVPEKPTEADPFAKFAKLKAVK